MHNALTISRRLAFWFTKKCPLDEFWARTLNHPPNLICSPLNLVPKVGNLGKFRLIHNLAFPYIQNSVNANIPDCHAKVSYQKFDVIVQLGLKHGPGCYAGKMDFDAAFRNIPLHLNDLPLLGFTLDDLYFINSSMAFGARSSCKIFEEFVISVQWILDNETNSSNSSSLFG